MTKKCPAPSNFLYLSTFHYLQMFSFVSFPGLAPRLRIANRKKPFCPLKPGEFNCRLQIHTPPPPNSTLNQSGISKFKRHPTRHPKLWRRQGFEPSFDACQPPCQDCGAWKIWGENEPMWEGQRLCTSQTLSRDQTNVEGNKDWSAPNWHT